MEKWLQILYIYERTKTGFQHCPRNPLRFAPRMKENSVFRDLFLDTSQAPGAATVRRTLQCYGTAAGYFVGALLLRLALNPALGSAVPYITFFSAIMVASRYCGFGPGLFTTVLSAVAVHFGAVPEPVPSALHGWTDELGLALFLGVGGMISWVNYALRREIARGHRLAKVLREHQERLQIALDAANEGLWEWKPDQNRMFFGPRFYALLGYEPDELPASLETWMKLIHPDDRTLVEKQFAEQIQRQRGTFQLEYRMAKKSGEYTWIQSRGKVIEWFSGRGPARVVGTIADVSERRSLEVQFHQAQRLDSIGTLAGGVAHDFNNLLTVINGYAALLLEDASLLEDGLREIRRAGERAASLTRQLLAFSRKQLLQPTVLNLNDIVGDIEKMLRRLIGEDIDLIIKLATELANITADAGQLQQVLMNLAVNSRDAMPGGGTLLIETNNVELDEQYAAEHPQVRTGRYIMLAITDSGMGMPPEVKERIFEPFFTTKPKGMGTGLGLATVYGIVKQMGGWIWVYSEPGQGTTFKVYFPRTDEGISTVPSLPKTDVRGTEVILVVEDQEEVRKLAVTALQRQGYTVYSAGSATEALKFCDQHQGPLELLLTDVIMPDTSGHELAKQVTTKRPRLRVLFMSGYTDNALAHHGVLNPSVAYIQKPFTPVSLAEKVRDVLGPHSSRNTILIVEDDDSIRRLLRHYLTSNGYAVLEASNGRQALQHLETSALIDLIVTDLIMPEQGGLDMVRRLHEEIRDIPVIAISGEFSLDLIKVVPVLGVVAALRKPVNRDELLHTIRKVLKS
jgi:PAS domain S-box-containing protein